MDLSISCQPEWYLLPSQLKTFHASTRVIRKLITSCSCDAHNNLFQTFFVYTFFVKNKIVLKMLLLDHDCVFRLRIKRLWKYGPLEEYFQFFLWNVHRTFYCVILTPWIIFWNWCPKNSEAWSTWYEMFNNDRINTSHHVNKVCEGVVLS